MKVDGLGIAIAIAEQGYRKSEFCKEFNLFPQTLNAIFKTNNTTMYTLAKIAKALNRPIKDFIVEGV